MLWLLLKWVRVVVKCTPGYCDAGGFQVIVIIIKAVCGALITIGVYIRCPSKCVRNTGQPFWGVILFLVLIAAFLALPGGGAYVR